MSRVVDYRVIQAEGTREIANAVKPFISTGWEPHHAPFIVATMGPQSVAILTFAQAIVKREPESAELGQLRHQLAAVREQLDAASSGVISEDSAVAAIEAVLS